MTGASKILTVSYGTFSCTLEGFDEPFNTMKAIAEYFRDLAAEDRYFGAEPPTPDAAMLHRIAEREIHRRVEAKIQDNGVILRAAEDGADAPAPVIAAPRPTLATAPSVSESVAAKLQRIRAKHTPAPAAAVAADDAYTEDEHAEDLPAQDLGAPVPEIEDAAHETPHAAPIEDFLTEAESLLGAETESDLEADDAPSFGETAAEGPADVDVSAEAAAAVDVDDAYVPEVDVLSAPVADSAEDDAADLEAAEDLALLDGLGADLTADVLPEDEAVQTEALDLPELAGPVEDEADMLSRLGGLVIDGSHELASDIDEEEAEDALYDAPEYDGAQEIATSDDAVLANLGAMINPDGDDDEDIAGEPVAEVITDLAVEDTPVAQPATEPTVAADETTSRNDSADTSEIDDLSEEPVQDERPLRARARVIRIRRAEPVTAQPAAGPGALSAEAEAALQAELAALEAELGGAKAAPAAAKAMDDDFDDLDLDGFFEDEVGLPAANSTAPQAEDARKRLNDDSKDDAVNRLIAHANSEMGGEETRRRQSAIAHLKAAVAATVADRKVTGSPGGQSETRQDAYRDDLDRVVRPRRPISETSTPRPTLAAPEPLQRPTPLVLVSEQRIDRPRATETAVQIPDAGPRRVLPVRPRRIGSGAAVAASVDHVSEVAAAPAVSPTMATAHPAHPQDSDLEDDTAALIDMDDEDTDNIFSDGAANFGEFAEQLGATALPDLLEAAAVYCAEVLQRPEFSRPLVMRQVAGLPGNVAANREDCLRGFGTLLRQGRIAKVKRGMFALTDRSPFLAEARKIAG